MVIGSLLDCLMRVTDSLWNLGAVKLNACESIKVSVCDVSNIERRRNVTHVADS